MNFAIPISVKSVATSFCIEGTEAAFNLLPPSNALSEFENDYIWSNLQEGFDYTIANPTILLVKFFLLEDMFQTLVKGISNGTASIVSECSFNCASLIGPVDTSAVILALST